MARDRASIIETIRRLLALATSECIGEAATAAAKAQELMERHSIQEQMVRDASTVEADKNEPIIEKVIFSRNATAEGNKSKGRLPTWVVQLADGVATVNRCKTLLYSSNYSGHISGIGTEANVEKCAFLLNWLTAEVDRLYIEEKPGYMDRGEGKRWANAFRLGAAATISNRLRDAQEKMREKMRKGLPLDEEAYLAAQAKGDIETILKLDADQKQYALVRVESALVKLDAEPKRVEDWMEENLNFHKAAPRNYAGTHRDGFYTGREAGKRADITGAKGHITG